MGLSSVLIGLAAVAVVASYANEYWRHRQNAQRLGCKEMPASRYNGFLGIGNILEAIKADKAKLFPDLIVQRFRDTCDYHGRLIGTYSTRIFTSDNIYTYDPKNIQAILATQFKDFCIGAGRQYCMGPLLGRGIVRFHLLSSRGGQMNANH